MLLEHKGWIKPVLGAAGVWSRAECWPPLLPAPEPHRARLHLAQDLLAVSLQPWCWFCHPPCSVSPGLGCCSAASALSWIRACPRWALPPELPLPVVPTSLCSAAHAQISAVPCVSTSCSHGIPPHAPLERPFPSRRQAPAACAQLKMETLASYCSSACSLGGSEPVPFGGQGVWNGSVCSVGHREDACPPQWVFGVGFGVPSSAHPSSHLATLLLSLPPARLLVRWGQVPQGGQHAQQHLGAGAEPLEGEQGGETSAAWRGQAENCLTFEHRGS